MLPSTAAQVAEGRQSHSPRAQREARRLIADLCDHCVPFPCNLPQILFHDTPSDHVARRLLACRQRCVPSPTATRWFHQEATSFLLSTCRISLRGSDRTVQSYTLT